MLNLDTVLIPVLLTGFANGVVTGKNVGPTHRQLAVMKEQVAWLRQGSSGEAKTYARHEVSKSGAVLLDEIIDPEHWSHPAPRRLQENGWVALVSGSYCKEGIQLSISPSTYKDHNAYAISMRYDAVSVSACASPDTHSFR